MIVYLLMHAPLPTPYLIASPGLEEPKGGFECLMSNAGEAGEGLGHSPSTLIPLLGIRVCAVPKTSTRREGGERQQGRGDAHGDAQKQT